ncbi:nuclear transport factor 2 family protein [Starkeya sp. ORNL1]|uniref:nuclear transport factor 2 family protein n=1 Tax=Starkeya sp. ORNL1 TaxID=2709380 RepID=UPI0014632B90|nr:nuclear transport factor 2 family protein [Starkeya sp. ORNL1]QJP14803.1 nuclear transport factor 2 family protein [Starkeya sp. ORNL1]
MDATDNLRLMELHCDAWNSHRIERLMALFAEDCVFEAAAGKHAFGERYSGFDSVKRAFAAIWEAFPDSRWEEAQHVVCGDQGFSEWTFRGTRADGVFVTVRGVDLLRFKDGKIARKDTFRKAVTA